MTSVLHEKAHVNGVRVEWKATCWAIPGVLEQLRRFGYTTRQLNAVRRYLTQELDRHRTSEYSSAAGARSELSRLILNSITLAVTVSVPSFQRHGRLGPEGARRRSSGRFR